MFKATGDVIVLLAKVFTSVHAYVYFLFPFIIHSHSPSTLSGCNGQPHAISFIKLLLIDARVQFGAEVYTYLNGGGHI